MKKEELNLDNPIFVFYIDIDGMSRQRAMDYIAETKDNFIYENAKIWIIPSKETKIECIYDGFGRNRNLELSDLIKQINKRVEILSNSGNFEDFKINIRDWRLSNIIDEEEK